MSGGATAEGADLPIPSLRADAAGWRRRETNESVTGR
jgi:hypothetical protein